MPGPSPNALKPTSRHRGRVALLPPAAAARVPAMPKGREWSQQERVLWRDLWRSPQASQWSEPFESAVAMYVVHACAVVAGTAVAWQAQEARHLADRLGLTPQGMASLGWTLSGQPTPASSVGDPGGGTVSALERARRRTAGESA